MNLKFLIGATAVATIGYQSYSKFKEYINNINVFLVDYLKNIDTTFTINVVLKNQHTSIIPYKIAKIELVDDNNNVIAESVNAEDLTKTMNITFNVLNFNAFQTSLSALETINKLDVVIYYNFFAFTHKRKYQQTAIINQQAIASVNNNSNIMTEEFFNNVATNLQQTACSCTQITGEK